MILHTVNRSPFQHDTLRACLRVAAAEDAILLIEDGVYGAIEESELARLLGDAPAPRVYALLADVEARGLTSLIQSSIALVDYRGFVDLTAQHDRVVSWF